MRWGVKTAKCCTYCYYKNYHCDYDDYCNCDCYCYYDYCCCCDYDDDDENDYDC